MTVKCKHMFKINLVWHRCGESIIYMLPLHVHFIQITDFFNFFFTSSLSGHVCVCVCVRLFLRIIRTFHRNTHLLCEDTTDL